MPTLLDYLQITGEGELVRCGLVHKQTVRLHDWAPSRCLKRLGPPEARPHLRHHLPTPQQTSGLMSGLTQPGVRSGPPISPPPQETDKQAPHWGFTQFISRLSRSVLFLLETWPVTCLCWKHRGATFDKHTQIPASARSLALGQTACVPRPALPLASAHTRPHRCHGQTVPG